MTELLIGTTLLVSFLGGVVALLAPCCVSVMLPAYLASGFRQRGGVLAASLVFGAGVATVILPIGLGATALSRLFLGQHLVIYLVGGLLMLAVGVASLAGWTPKLPMPPVAVAAERALVRRTCWGHSLESPAPAARRCWPGWCCSPGRRPRSRRRC